jgi:hypothetical protein
VPRNVFYSDLPQKGAGFSGKWTVSRVLINLAMTPQARFPAALAITSRSFPYFVLKRILMVLVNPIAGSKPLVFWETSLESTPHWIEVMLIIYRSEHVLGIGVISALFS